MLNIIANTALALSPTKIETLGDGSQRPVFAGIPGRSYRVQSIDYLARRGGPHHLERRLAGPVPVHRAAPAASHALVPLRVAITTAHHY